MKRYDKCPLCGRRRPTARTQQYCDAGHQQARMIAETVERAVDEVLGRQRATG